MRFEKFLQNQGAHFDFTVGNYFKKDKESFFSQKIKIRRRAQFGVTDAILICSGGEKLANVNKKLSTLLTGNWYKSFMYFKPPPTVPPNEQHVEGPSDSSPGVGQWGTASEPGK